MTSPGSHPQHRRGFTLLEAAATVAVLGIAIATAVPSLQRLLDGRRIDGVATQVAADLQLARSEAVARSQAVRVSFQPGPAGTTCYVIHTGPTGACPCGSGESTACASPAEHIKTARFDGPDRVSVEANVGSLMFDATHGTSSPAGTVRVIGAQGRAVHQVVNLMGRIRSCSPQNAVSGYRSC